MKKIVILGISLLAFCSMFAGNDSIAKTKDCGDVAKKKVVRKVRNPDNEISLADARKVDDEAKVGQWISIQIDKENFGHMAVLKTIQAAREPNVNMHVKALHPGTRPSSIPKSAFFSGKSSTEVIAVDEEPKD